MTIGIRTKKVPGSTSGGRLVGDSALGARAAPGAFFFSLSTLLRAKLIVRPCALTGAATDYRTQVGLQ